MARTAPARQTERRHLVTVDRLAEQYDVHPRTVRRWISDGMIYAYSLPGSRRVYVDENEVAEAFVPVRASRPRSSR